MMLSNEDIKKCLDNGQLVIKPFNPKQIRAAGITLHLGSKLLKPLAGSIVDVRKKTLPKYQEIEITLDKPYELKPQEFVLGETYELVTVGNQIGFFIEGRSTLARLGLTIVQTAMLVEPGHADRAVTLELANHGPNSILLYPKMKISRVALYELKTPSSKPYDKDGKYRKQTGVGQPILEDEFIED